MKRFLEDYGFTILAAIVVISLIMIVTPIGSTIQKQTGDLVHSFAVVADDDFNKIDDSTLLIDLKNFNKSGVEGDFSRKGNLVTINGNQFRVLSVNGTQAKLLAMDSYKSIPFGANNTYSGSTLDTEMTNYYNTLPADVQNAIVEQNINQSKYIYNDGTNESTNFSSWYKNGFTESDISGANYYLNKKSETSVGNRKVYALDVDDVIFYLGSTSTPQDVNELFFNQRSSVSRNIWLRSAHVVHTGGAFSVRGDYGFVFGDLVFFQFEVRPAFVIDLSLLSE